MAAVDTVTLETHCLVPQTDWEYHLLTCTYQFLIFCSSQENNKDPSVATFCSELHAFIIYRCKIRLLGCCIHPATPRSLIFSTVAQFFLYTKRYSNRPFFCWTKQLCPPWLTHAAHTTSHMCISVRHIWWSFSVLSLDRQDDECLSIS